MSLSKEEVKKVSKLAHLETDDAQLERIQPELNNILGFIEKLGEVDTDNVEPLASPVEGNTPTRTDEVNDGANAKAVISNAPEEKQGYYVVKKIVE